MCAYMVQNTPFYNADTTECKPPLQSGEKSSAKFLYFVSYC